jgi:hypothetical protein
VRMEFERGMTTPITETPGSRIGYANPLGPWAKLEGNYLPDANILVWAPHTIGDYTFNGTSAAEYQSLFDHMADSGMMPRKITCDGNRLNTYWVPSHGSWVAFAGMSAKEAHDKDELYRSQDYRRISWDVCDQKYVGVWFKN